MDLNNINLSPFIVANLYKNSLVEMKENNNEEHPAVAIVQAEPAKQTTNTPEKNIKSLGENRKGIVILVRNPGITHLTDDDLSFLTGILNACKLTLADVAIVNLANHPGTGYEELGRFFSSKIMLLFDIDPQSIRLPMVYPHYQLLAFSGNTYLNAPSLKQLTGDKAEKMKLWTSLKRLFNL